MKIALVKQEVYQEGPLRLPGNREERGKHSLFVNGKSGPYRPYGRT